MALLKGKRSEIPSDAVVLTESQALEYQSKILKNWKNPADIFAFKYGGGFLVGATVLTGLYLNNYLRGKLKLGHYGRGASYLPICVVPAAFSFLFHSEEVLKDIVLLKTDNCPICLELRASAIQAISGTVLPVMMASMTSLMLTNKYATSRLPSLRHEPLNVFKFAVTKLKPIQNILLAIFVGHALLGSAVTYFEAQSIFRVHEKMAKIDRDMEEMLYLFIM